MAALANPQHLTRLVTELINEGDRLERHVRRPVFQHLTRLLPRSRHPKATVTVRQIDGPIKPGDEIGVDVCLLSEEPTYIREASIDLVCIETFWYTVKATGAAWVGSYPGHGEENRGGPPYTAAGRPGRYKASRELVRLSQTFLTNCHIGPGIPHQGRAKFRLPPTAPPSVAGETACIEWQLHSSIPTEGAMETRRIGRLEVVSALPWESAGAVGQTDSPSVTEECFQQCSLSLSLPTNRAWSGQSIGGDLMVTAHQDQFVPQVRAVLECWERAGVKQSVAPIALVELQHGAQLKAGCVYQWPFQLQVPDRLLPTTRTGETTVTWRVKGALGRVLRTGLEVQQRIQVFTGS